VRFERIIRAGRAERQYYCGACTHAWVVPDQVDTNKKRDDK
jgi:hypothetical protein